MWQWIFHLDIGEPFDGFVDIPVNLASHFRDLMEIHCARGKHASHAARADWAGAVHLLASSDDNDAIWSPSRPCRSPLPPFRY